VRCYKIAHVRKELLLIGLLSCAALVAQQPSAPQLAKDPGAFIEPEPEPVRKAPLPPAGPTPHLADGRPDFGGKGAWFPGFSGNIAELKWKGVKSADKRIDVPFLPSSLALFNERVETIGKDDPEARCLPVGVPRYMFDPYAFQMIQTADSVIFIFEGDNYPWRIVPTDGRQHSKDPNPTWMGEGVGHYEGDTLVIDVIGFNGKAWLDQAGHAQTTQAHIIERYTRTDSRTLKYEVTIDDPAAYSAPWIASNTVYWRPGFELAEYVCNENEKSSAHMIGK
jgi:hypothetical protein